MSITNTKEFLCSHGEKLIALGFILFITYALMSEIYTKDVYVKPIGALGGFIASLGMIGQLLYYKEFFQKEGLIFIILKIGYYFMYYFSFVFSIFIFLHFFISIYDFLIVFIS